MKKTIAFMIVILLLATASATYAGTLNMRFRAQEMNQWCWAATSQAVIGYKTGSYPSQCKINDTAWNKTYCCSSPSSCNSPNSMQAIADVCTAYGANSSTYGVLSMSNITYLIDARRPFIMGWQWTSGGGHALLGYGYSGNYVTYWDPWQGNGTTTANYNNVVRSSRHNWTSTSYTH